MTSIIIEKVETIPTLERLTSGISTSCGMQEFGEKELDKYVEMHDNKFEKVNKWFDENDPNFEIILKTTMERTGCYKEKYSIFRKMLVWEKFMSQYNYKIVCDEFVKFVNENLEKVVTYDSKFSHPLCCETAYQFSIEYIKTNNSFNMEDEIIKAKVNRIIDITNEKFNYFIESIHKINTPSIIKNSIGDKNLDMKKYYADRKKISDNDIKNKYVVNFLNSIYNLKSLEEKYDAYTSILIHPENYSDEQYNTVCYEFAFFCNNKNVIIYDNKQEIPIEKKLIRVREEFPTALRIEINVNSFRRILKNTCLSLLYNEDEYGKTWQENKR